MAQTYSRVRARSVYRWPEAGTAKRPSAMRILRSVRSLLSLSCKFICDDSVQFQGTLAQWFVFLQLRNYTKLTKKQYLELNVRIQKSLIMDFDLQSAQDSALEDCNIEIESETNEWNAAAAATSDFQEEPKNEPHLIEFECLSEFFFNLCLSCCDTTRT